MTPLPPQLKIMYSHHRAGMVKVLDWLEKQGIVLFYRDNIIGSTVLDLHIRHDNDYIEMGPNTDDPDGVMFHVYTKQNVKFDVPLDKLSHLMKAVKEHQSIGKKRIAPHISIETDVGNQFIMQKHIFANDYSWEKVEISLEFRIYHEFQEVS